MRYITHYDGPLLWVWGTGKGGKAIVRDTVESGQGVVEVEYCEALGVGHDWRGLGAVALHTKKTAMLHSHIVSVDYKLGLPQLPINEMDSATIRGMGPIVRGFDTVAVGMSDLDVSVFGILGSVVLMHRNRGEAVKTATLYDFLGMACKNTGLNLMSYRVINMYSTVREYTIRIERKTGVQANRFFTKMAMDVIR